MAYKGLEGGYDKPIKYFYSHQPNFQIVQQSEQNAFKLSEEGFSFIRLRPRQQWNAEEKKG